MAVKAKTFYYGYSAWSGQPTTKETITATEASTATEAPTTTIWNDGSSTTLSTDITDPYKHHFFADYSTDTAKVFKEFFEQMTKGVKKADGENEESEEEDIPKRHTAKHTPISIVIEEKKDAEICDDCGTAIWIVERLYKGDKNYTCWIGNGMDYLEEHTCVGNVEYDEEN